MENISNHRLLFCINSGRCGSQYLARLLNSTKEVVAFHEAEPKMIESYVRLIENKSYEETREARRIKSYAIKQTLLGIPKSTAYCDTSNMFIKTFYDVIMEDFKESQVEVIILRRNLVQVLKSFMECGYYSDKNKNWDNFFHRSYAVTSAIDSIKDYSNMDKYDQCIAYLIDIEARAIRFQSEYQKVKIHNLRLEELQNLEYVKKKFNSLNLSLTKDSYHICGKKINTKVNQKKQISERVSLEYCRERIYKYLEKAKLEGIQIPKTLALENN